MVRIKTHPREVLQEEFMQPLDIGARKLGEALGVPHTRILAIAKEQRSMTADTALRPARYFDTTPQFWMNLQTAHDVSKTYADRGEEIERQVAAHA